MLGKLTIYKNRIVYYYHWGGKTLRYKTGITIDDPANFSGSKLNKKEADFAKKNIRLYEVRSRVDDIITKFIANNQGKSPDVDFVRAKLRENERKPDDKILEVFNEFFDELKETRTYGTYKMYNVLRNSIEKYIAKTKKRNIAQIDQSFVSEYEKYLNSYSDDTM